MKEFERKPINELTNQPQTPYSKGGEISMPENGEQPSQKPSEQNRETPSNNAEKVVKAGKAWKEYLAKEGQPWESLNTALRRGFMDKINMGEMPPEMKEGEAGGEQKAKDERQGPPVLTQEAKDIIENVASGGIFLSVNASVERILRENGISQKDIDSKTPQELIDLLRAKAGTASDKKVPPPAGVGGSGTGGGKPPGEPPSPPAGEQPNQQSSEDDSDGEQTEENPEGESQREAIKRLIEKNARGSAERRGAIAELLKQFSPLGTYVPEILIDYSLEYEDVFESLVNRIVSLPLDKETSNYSLGLFAGSNLETMSDRVTQAIDKAANLPERDKLRRLKDRLTLAQESSTLIHDMNKLVITGEMEGFIRTAEGITPEHLNYLQKLDGVGIAMQVYDEVYQKYLAKYGWIYPFVAKQLHREVFERLGDYNKQKVFGERQLEEWELRRAYNVGRKFFNTSFRSAELVATGTVPVDLEEKAKAAMVKAIGEAMNKGDQNTVKELKEELAEWEKQGKQRFSSFPLESAARIMNPIQLTIYRFMMADKRGSQIFLKNAKKYFQEFLRRNGDKNDINKITTLGGVSVEQMEYGGVFLTSGIFSSWRNENFLFPQMKITINGKKTTVRDWLANNAYEIESAKSAKDSKALAKALAKALEPLIDNMDVGLGILLKQGVFSGKLAYEARRQLWGKILLGKRYEGVDVDPKAEENPEIGNLPLLINYLEGIKVEKGVKTKDHSGKEIDFKISSIDEIKTSIVPDGIRNEEMRRKYWDTPDSITTEEEMKKYWDTPEDKRGKAPSRWKILLDKIHTQHSINIKRNIGQVSGAQDPKFTNEEREIIKAIKLEGKKLPEHLADIAFPYTPFMNDAPFEIFNYEIAGAEFYRRRAAGDIPSYFNAAKAFMAIIDNPGGMGIEEAIKQFRELERGIESPQGAGDAQQRTFPLFEAWIDWVMTRRWERYSVLKSLKQTMQMHTSDAQEWSGMSAPTVNEQQARDLVEHAVLAGILNEKLGDELKKKKNIKFLGIFWMLFRDVFTTVIPAITIYSLGKEIGSSKR